MATSTPYSPQPVRVRTLTIGAWLRRKADHDDLVMVRNLYRHEKRLQLVRPDLDQAPFTITFAELRRDYQTVRSA